MLFIFDLDGTTIDSSHRQNTLPDGSLNLDAWVRNNTPEKIARDSLLPMAESWKTINRQNHQIVIMTARVIGKADLKFLADNGFEIQEIIPVGDYYSWLGVELARTGITHSIVAKVMLFPAFIYFFSKKKTKLSTDTLCMGYHVLAKKRK